MPSQSFPSGRFATTPPADRAIATIAGRQHGVIQASQLHAAGLSNSAITKRVARGLLHRRYRGVYCVGPLAREGEFLAAVFAGGDGAVLSHLAVAELRGLLRYRAPSLDVIVLRRRRSPPGVRFHEARRLHPRDVTTHKGVPVTSVARLLVDLTDVLSAEELTNVIHEAAYRGRFSLLATQDALARANGRHNLHVLHDALSLYAAGSRGTKSRGEVIALALLAAHGLPRPLVNVDVHGHEVDFHWPALRLVVELDGPGHARPPTQRDDARRDAALHAAGYQVVRVDDPAQVVRRVKEAARSPRTAPA